MYEAKTRPTKLSVASYLAGIEDGHEGDSCLLPVLEQLIECSIADTKHRYPPAKK